MLEKLIRTVKGQLGYFDNQVRVWSRDPDRPGFDPHKLAKYKQLAYEFQDVLDYLLQQRRAGYTSRAQFAEEIEPHVPATDEPSNLEELEPAPLLVTSVSVPSKTTSTAARSNDGDDLSDLPPELLKELSDSFKGETDPLIQIINDRGGTASIDEILVDLYRKHGEIGKRPIISNKLYRFSRRGLCAAMPGKKGIYTTNPEMLHVVGEEEEEDPDGEPSGSTSNNGTGVAGSPERPSNPSPDGSTPSTSTFKPRRELFASTAIPTIRVPK
jgi:hypothetical protein